MSQDTQDTIYSIAKTPSQEVRLSARGYKERLYMDLRIYFKREETDEWFPTKRGITLPLELLHEIQKGFQKLEAHFQDQSEMQKTETSEGKV